MSAKDALLLVNMGGPANAGEVAPYLRAIFRDPFILPVPGLLRRLAGWMIVRKRTDAVIEKYKLIGGGSPLLAWTESLAGLMREQANGRYSALTHACRYSAPLIGDALASLKRQGIERVTLLSLFPHSTRAMTGSIEVEAKRHAAILGLTLIVVPVWGLRREMLDLQAAYLAQAVEDAGGETRVLFVAHGIPMRDVKRGDSYPEQVSANAGHLAETLPPGVSWSLAYQSRVGPVAWTGPYLEDEIQHLATVNHPVVIMPLSFVADCLETLYDLDLIAVPELKSKGVSVVVRVPAYNDDPRFAAALLRLAEETHDA